LEIFNKQGSQALARSFGVLISITFWLVKWTL